MHSRISLICVALLCITLSSKALANDFDKRVARVYAEVEKMIAKGDSEGVFKVLYREDSVVAGEGVPFVARSTPELIRVIDSVLAETRSCAIQQDPARGFSDRYSYSFVTYKCEPKNGGAALHFRALYVWEERNGELKVVAELFGVGLMD